jgi:hypothetical protein
LIEIPQADHLFSESHAEAMAGLVAAWTRQTIL